MVGTVKFLKIKNNQAAPRSEIPCVSYESFYEIISSSLENGSIHCISYFAFPDDGKLIFICALADDEKKEICLLSHGKDISEKTELKSLTAEFPAMHIFEREINENFGVGFSGHPWLKPVRYPHNRFDSKAEVNDYPFYKIESHELHEVGVGPIHAGVIEPGHFRFTCNGEMVLHLEIQLGWQHRGIESLFLSRKRLIERTMLAEQIAGDTTVGHCLAFAHAMESMSDLNIGKRVQLERAIALELERIAIHTGDMSALCNDVAYQLGTAVFGVLRTPIINFTQAWCGNRLGRSMVRVGGTWNPLTKELKDRLISVLDDYERRFLEMANHADTLAGFENRFENIGSVTEKQAGLIGTVGMAAKMSGIKRDVRWSHPFGAYESVDYEPALLQKGDVLSRFILRKLEVIKSIEIIRGILNGPELNSEEVEKPANEVSLNPSSVVVSLVEGWRGEICHIAVTDDKGDLEIYKIKDPSMHNWKALELSLRDLEISDFPINNKSYNLSYCGYDL